MRVRYDGDVTIIDLAVEFESEEIETLMEQLIGEGFRKIALNLANEPVEKPGFEAMN